MNTSASHTEGRRVHSGPIYQASREPDAIPAAGCAAAGTLPLPSWANTTSAAEAMSTNTAGGAQRSPTEAVAAVTAASPGYQGPSERSPCSEMDDKAQQAPSSAAEVSSGKETEASPEGDAEVGADTAGDGADATTAPKEVRVWCLWVCKSRTRRCGGGVAGGDRKGGVVGGLARGRRNRGYCLLLCCLFGCL